ncbi:hypothetical protein V4V36_31620 [Paenibacillus lautus]|jgi:hypothetical protein|uniref:Uncharacterized protein n=1 Tax=Paenibacillus lautus TaxID=1401 RepID=A0A2A5LFM2_PAELA|nr:MULTISPECIES: hypothetical protein [Paenibacillus]MBY0162975.1 hypothetical protein [Cytobacillus firmus]VTR61744.1 Uncharacterised protein [Actinobacillus pleuropneumoniae]ACX67722.1 conserved hypothetical protein [Paenibacillus sp. Y412MC10]AYB42212.1 hypothetical protein D5F53_02495 [Paenibacillus lautus]EGG36587.1 hypothetical protein HMPREF9412_6069 [Paenibacillus sp. HGF5]
MRNSKGNGMSILLIGLGILVLLGVFGPLLGWLFSLLIPILMVALGYYGIRRGNTLMGWIILGIGIIWLMGKLSWLIGPILGVILIIYGVSRLKNGRPRY